MSHTKKEHFEILGHLVSLAEAILQLEFLSSVSICKSKKRRVGRIYRILATVSLFSLNEEI